MRKFRFALNILAIAVFSLAISSVAQAQATRTWVSGVGDDANPCSRTAPCKTFAGAISKTAPGGEISVLDPGGFGAVTITKAITIDGEGTLAGILSASTNGILVNAGVNDVVHIRNVLINGTSGANIGLNGIRYLAGKSLIVENCMISGFSQRGIDVSLNAGTGKLSVINTTITTGFECIGGQSGNFSIAIFNSRLMNSTNAALNLLTGTATISDSLVAHNSSFAVIAQGSATITCERTVISHNGTGVSATGASANVLLSNATINNNTTGIASSGGTVRSFLNNSIAPGQGAPNASTGQQ